LLKAFVFEWRRAREMNPSPKTAFTISYEGFRIIDSPNHSPYILIFSSCKCYELKLCKTLVKSKLGADFLQKFIKKVSDSVSLCRCGRWEQNPRSLKSSIRSNGRTFFKLEPAHFRWVRFHFGIFL